MRRILGYLIPSSHYALLALLFFVGLEVTFAFPKLIFPLLLILFLLMLAGILLVRIEEKGRFRLTQALLPVLAVAGLTGFAFFLPHNRLLHTYFMVAGLLLFWLLRNATKVAYPTWNWTLSTVVMFLNVATILGLRFHLYWPIFLVLPLLLSVTFLISFQAVRRLAHLLSEGALLALGIAIGLTEIAWTLQFLPLHYVVQSGVLVAFYYVFFHLISVSYERRLQRKDITEYVAIGAGALLLILVTARWK